MKSSKRSKPMMSRNLAFPGWARRHAADWLALWGASGFESRITLEFSSRMTRFLGRCYPERRLIRLSERLRHGPRGVLEEALCHELAHIAVFELNGKNCRPHGPEWKVLMQRAGVEPRTRLYLGGVPPRKRKKRRHYLYIHRCPVCHAERVGRRTVRKWRCAACVEAGLDGKLQIWRRPVRGARLT